MDAILPVYKPVGITSFDVIRSFKRSVHPDFKIGHGGTLDPFADGVLLLLLGKATKKMNELSELPKTYRAVARLGACSDTLDVTGTITKFSNPKFSNSQILETAKDFVGEIEQVIPDYSATKINGVPRYKLARAGKEMEQKSKRVQIHALTIEKIEGELVTFVSTVSSGTYIRQLSYDMFKSLGIESYLEKLTRTEIGDYKIENCCEITDFSDLKWQGTAEHISLPARDA
ncbi:tRNA pseudouridine(55) synthase TruB [Candidatus Woesebacteria bacterium]|nr:tRNA pseudouridine(55) synthase TruB [Candidatus Woesebacteria bacterium]